MLVTVTNISSPAEQVHIPSMGSKFLEPGESVTYPRTFADLDGDTSMKTAIQAGLVSLAFEAETIDSAQVFFGAVPLSFSDTTRGSATLVPVLSSIWNTDDNAMNWSDGTNWRDAAGTIT